MDASRTHADKSPLPNPQNPITREAIPCDAPPPNAARCKFDIADVCRRLALCPTLTRKIAPSECTVANPPLPCVAAAMPFTYAVARKDSTAAWCAMQSKSANDSLSAAPVIGVPVIGYPVNIRPSR